MYCKFNFLKIKAYDIHLNLLLSDVEERITTKELDTESGKELTKIIKKNFGLIYVRGDLIIMISPPNK